MAVTAPTWGPGHPAHAAKRGLATRAILAIVAGAVAMLLVVAAIVFAIFVRGGDTMLLKVPGAGMEPTIHAGRTLSARKVDPGAYRPQRADIVVFTAPDGWSTGGDKLLLKRVIGLPGEHLACCDAHGRWTVDGQPLTEPYLRAGDPAVVPPADVVVPEGRLWVMGDNRLASYDSCSVFAMTADITAATIPLSSVTALVKKL